MKYARTLGITAFAGVTALLSGCVVAPLDAPGYYQSYPARPAVYVQPPPVVVVPARPYYYPGRGYRHWR